MPPWPMQGIPTRHTASRRSSGFILAGPFGQKSPHALGLFRTEFLLRHHVREQQFCRTFEQLVRQVLNRIPSRRLLFHAGEIAMPAALFLVPYVTFALENTQHR